MPDPLALRPGSTVANRYEIEALLGAAGPGPVFRALDTHLQRRVTLRTFPSAGWSAEERELFENALRGSAPIDHPHLAGIRDFGTDPAIGADFVVAEPLNGETLAMLLAHRGAPPLPLTLRILQEAAEGIGAAHWAGLVHGEIHPGTIFLSRGETDRRMRVQALLPGLQLSLVAGGKLPPFARYAAPEVLRRQSPPTPGSDVFSLGVVAYELLVGLPDRWSAILTEMVRSGKLEIPAPADLRPEVPADLSDAVMRALQPHPARRFPDANAFAIVLAHATDASTGPAAVPAAPANGIPDFLREDADEPDADRAAPEEPPLVLAPMPRPEETEGELTAASARIPAEAAEEIEAEREPTLSPFPSPIAAPVPAVYAQTSPAQPSPEPYEPVEILPRRSVPKTAILAASIVGVLAVGTLAYSLGSGGGDPPTTAASATAPPAGRMGASPAVLAANTAMPDLDTEESAAEEPAAPQAPAASAPQEIPAPSPLRATAPAVETPAPVARATESPSAPPVRTAAVPPAVPQRTPPPAAVAARPMDLAPSAPANVPVAASDDGPDMKAVYGIGEVSEPPRLRNGPALQRALERSNRSASGGRIVLQFIVLPNGRIDPSTVEVVESSSAALRASGSRVITQAQFTPGRIGKDAVKVRVTMPVVLAPGR